MSERADLLVEIGTEELPPKALSSLSQAFADGIVAGCAQQELGHGAVQAYATPRRLAVLVRDVVTRQADRQVERRGPAVTAAFDDEGCPTKAAQGFARSCGVDVEQLATLDTPKGSWLVYRHTQTGRPSAELLPAIVEAALERLPIPKRMRWGAGEAQFVRPVHWAVLLLGEQLVECQLLSVATGRTTRGHRFHHPSTLHLGEAAAYAPLLETEGRVLADFAARRTAVRAQVLEAAAQLGGRAVIDDALLDEVTAMVEWPVAVVGDFAPEFLQVPAEALVSAMKNHQKYFHLVDAKGGLLPHFIAISNIESRDPAVVRAGNERVIRPRLADAGFFWQQDRKQRLAQRVAGLEKVVFQHKLGTLLDKTQRLRALARVIAEQLGAAADQAERAAELCKADLLTDLVGEFPELQGIMGRYCAQHDGEPEAVAQAIEQHYWPRFAGDHVPRQAVASAVALADKLDTLVGIFAIGRAPSGDKDPFSLRRAALGTARILVESQLALDLPTLIARAAAAYNEQRPGLVGDAVADDVYDFILGRVQTYYAAQDYAHDEIDAVLSLRPTDLSDLDQRLRALAAFRKLDEAASLAEANKRISNILKQAAQEAPDQLAGTFSSNALADNAEQVLAERVLQLEQELQPLFSERAYEAIMQRLAQLRTPVDRFFVDVMVMSDDLELRRNRLALLQRMRDLFMRVADISRLQTG